MVATVEDFSLTLDELRVVARYAAEAAQGVLSIFEEVGRADSRPRLAVEAALVFANGAARTNMQRVAAFEAHRAAKGVRGQAAHFAAMAAGDAAAAAYLHPLAEATQVGHILRADANAARSLELHSDGDLAIGDAYIQAAGRRAIPALIDILKRYPAAPTGKSRVTRLMKDLDMNLRTRG